jgi:signal peptidase I
MACYNKWQGVPLREGDILNCLDDKIAAFQIDLDAALREAKDLASTHPFNHNIDEHNIDEHNIEDEDAAAIVKQQQPEQQEITDATVDDLIVAASVVVTKKGKSKWAVFAFEAVFYIMIAVVLVCVLLFVSAGSNRHFSVLGFSAMHMPTATMQSEIPHNSLVITRRVPAEELKTGDDIAFFMAPSLVIIHRIIDINNGFATKGIDAEHPDIGVVPAANIIGRVIFHSHSMGRTLIFARQNTIITVAVSVLIIGLFTTLRSHIRSKMHKEEAHGFD